MFDTALYPDLWSYLAAADKPIAVYGMGNGADKLFSVLSLYGLTPAAVFASDPFVRGQSYRGYTVQKAADVFAAHPDCIVLVAFGSRLPEMLSLLAKMAETHELYIPDLPVAGDPAAGDPYFCADFYQAHRSAFDEARGLLSDDRSKEVFDLVIQNKLTGDPDALFASSTEGVYDEIRQNILRPKAYRSYLDLGAYRGDTLEELLRWRADQSSGESLTADFDFFAMEPDSRNFKKLCLYTASVFPDTVQRAAEDGTVYGDGPFCYALFPYAAWDEQDTAVFSSGGNRNSNITPGKNLQLPSGAKTVTVPLAAADDLIGEKDVDYIKYDVEGAEYQALLGSARLLSRRPDLSVASYHRPEDLCQLPQLLHRLCPDHKLYLRRLPCVPLWELNLYATL